VLDILQEISAIFTVPILIVIGWAVYVTWSKQEKLYLRQISEVESRFKSAQNEISLLKDKLDQPSEILASVELMKGAFHEQLRRIEDEKEQLLNLLETREKENTRVLTSIEESAHLSSWDTFQILRHEARNETEMINRELLHMARIIDEKVQGNKEQKLAINRALKGAEERLQRLADLFDQQKLVEQYRRNKETVKRTERHNRIAGGL